MLNEKIIVLAVSPINHGTLLPNDLIDKLINGKISPIIFKLDTEAGCLCDIGIGDLRALRRRLNYALPAVERSVEGSRISKNVEKLSQTLGNQRGLVYHITGGGYRQ